MTINIEYCWPIDFPEDVPCKDKVVPAQGAVYRLVRTIPPENIDFQRHRDEKPNYPYTREQIPLSYGVSFWSKLDKIKRVKDNYPCPEQYESWKVATGNLTPDLGVVPEELSIDGHITLWVQDGVEPHKYIKNGVTL